MNLNLKGKAAIITGAGRGIGRAIALAFAKEGADVVVSDIDIAAANEVTKEIESLGSRAIGVRADVRKIDQVEMMVNQTLNKFGKVDILINNAGIVYEADGPIISRKLFSETVPEDWHKEVDIILYGTMNCIKTVLDHMIKQRGGRIVNIASDFGRTRMVGSVVGASIYSAAKGGVIAFSRMIAMEVGSYGITVNSVSPSMVRTTRALLIEQQKETHPKKYEYIKGRENISLAATPLGRLGEPEDVAKLVVFLASDAASWITGQTYSVNGGQVMI